MKALTEKQAWLKIARAFEDAQKQWLGRSYLTHFGLCYAVRNMWYPSIVSRTTFSDMEQRLDLYCNNRVDDKGYLWPLDQKHAKHRAALARRFAKACE
jgi:hypothetical protein